MKNKTQNTVEAKNEMILITGASTGIGKATALYLDKCGYHVFAGVRKKEDADKLKEEASPMLKPIFLDVTDSETIKQAVDEINSETDGKLFGLINNAGIGISGVLETLSIEDIRKVYDVNVFGLMNVTKAFIPLLRETRGRIINIGSSLGFISYPGTSAYSSSKFAVRAINDTLRLELKHFGISVSLVSPGAVESEIWNKSKNYKEKLIRSADPEIIGKYQELVKFGEKLNDKIKPIPAIEAAKVVAKSLQHKKPNRYYYVGSDVKVVAKLSYLPKSILDWMIIKRIKKIGTEK